MFTGLIQTTGTIRAITPELLQIAWCPSAPQTFLQGMEIGDSIAVNGICLTVTKILSDSFWAAVSPETLARTILGQSRPQDIVNLESSLRVGSKIGGHFVTGHIDGVGYFRAATQTANSWEMRFAVTNPMIARYIVPKGSIAVNGISLTIADCDSDGSWFMVAIIPLTYEETNLKALRVDQPVNLEGDVLGKYVEKFLRIDHDVSSSHQEQALNAFSFMANQEAQDPANQREPISEVTAEYLAEHGYG